MKIQQISSSLRSPRSFFLGLLPLLLLLTLSACGSNNSVKIYDNARVLSTSKVQNAASNLSNPVAVYTTNTFQGTEADFQRTAIQKLNGNPDMIVMAIDTNSRYIYIARGSHVPLSSTNINQAVNSFSGNFNNGNYTNASVAALNSMQNSISATNQSRGGSGFNPLIPCLILPLLIVLGIALFAASKRGRMRGMTANGNPWQRSSNVQGNEGQYYDPNQGYGSPNQGYGPYNQGYGSPNQRGGMNPWAAGGLGAAAGGLAGYELGKRSGEGGSERNNDSNDDFGGGGGNFGSGNDPNAGGSNFGGGNDPNGGGGSFGSSNDPSGGGGNFGGGFGGSNLFGGGGSFGGGNDDFGGGGSFGGGNDDFGGGGSFGSGNDSGGGNF